MNFEQISAMKAKHDSELSVLRLKGGGKGGKNGNGRKGSAKGDTRSNKTPTVPKFNGDSATARSTGINSRIAGNDRGIRSRKTPRPLKLPTKTLGA